jgi:hypothetical protein
MTPEEWERCEDPDQMLVFLQGKASDRKMRLFAAACCRRISHLITDGACRRAVELAELYADGLASPSTDLRGYSKIYPADAMGIALAGPVRADPGQYLSTPHTVLAHVAAIQAVFPPFLPRLGDWPCAYVVASAAATALGRSGNSILPAERWAVRDGERGLWLPLGNRHRHPPEDWAVYEDERRKQTVILRDIVGNPFQPSALDPAWRTAAVVLLAQAVYEHRTFDRFPVLADLLEEAGATDAGLLGHLRGPGPHCLGCHALDAVLGKS